MRNALVLFKLGFGVLVILMVLGSFCAGFANILITTEQVQTSAERNSLDFSDRLEWKPTGSVCSGLDSDQDGYVTCTVSTESKEVKSLECGYDKNWAPFGQNKGCKLKQFINLDVSSKQQQ